MGYQVGSQCFATKAEAENHQFSQIVPVINSKGELVMPVYSRQQQQWQYMGTAFTTDFPECSPGGDFVNGMYFGAQFMVVLVLAAGFRMAKNAILRMVDSPPAGD